MPWLGLDLIDPRSRFVYGNETIERYTGKNHNKGIIKDISTYSLKMFLRTNVEMEACFYHQLKQKVGLTIFVLSQEAVEFEQKINLI